METLKKEMKLCLSCMEEHEVLTVKVHENNVLKGKEVEYDAVYDYCDVADEYTATDEMIKVNDISFKDAYRRSCRLLTSTEICGIRKKYGISQTDLATLLGMGAKTITRYESSQIQDAANDAMLRKLDSDPDWFITLLEGAKGNLTETAYRKYRQRALELYAENADVYRRKAIAALYADLCDLDDCCGNTMLDLDKMIEAINFFANSPVVSSLYKVKLMKLLWYADFLSYKRYGAAITGLAYKALPMGAVPIGHESIIDLNGVLYEEIEFSEGTGNHFIPSKNFKPKLLNDKDIAVLNTIVSKLGGCSKNEIVRIMHEERAYKETAPYDIIQFQYACELSID